MRQIGNLPNESDAQRCVAYLITQGIAASVEEDKTGWDIWVRDEDQLERAKAEFAQFKLEPSAAKYSGVKRQAEQIMRDELRQRDSARKNVVEMRGKWSQGAGRKAPLVFLLIALSVGATIWTNFGKNETKFGHLSFCSPSHFGSSDWSGDNFLDTTVDIRNGQLWRLVTPIFVHLSILHLVFNSYWTYVLGSQIEDRRGTFRLAMMVLTFAVISNLAQTWVESPWFGGMSGVGYGLFGYAWMKSLYDPNSGIHIPQSTVFMFILWFFICLSGVTGPVANTAHAAGIFVGVVMGYAPVLLGPTKQKGK